MELALRAEGHEVFFDRTSLTAGHSFHSHIREQINSADALVFLVSPASIGRGGYALTELKLAQEQWPSPAGRILPVLVEPTPLERSPSVPSSRDGPRSCRQRSSRSRSGCVEPAIRRAELNSIERSCPHASFVCFVEAPDRAAFFINITNVCVERDTEIIIVWMETSPRTHVTPNARPLPVRLRPFKSQETWIYFDELPSIPDRSVYEMARVRLSTGEVIARRQVLACQNSGSSPGQSLGRE